MDAEAPHPPGRRELAVAIVAGGFLCVAAVLREDQRQTSTSVQGSAQLEPVRRRFLVLGDRGPAQPAASEPPMRSAPAPLASSSAATTGKEPSAARPSGAPVDPDLEALAVETFQDARPALVECLRVVRRERPDASGKLPVSVVIDQRGLVASVTLGPSPLRGAEFDECATLSLATLVFPATLGARDISITFDLR
jgi:hypothetical protein